MRSNNSIRFADLRHLLLKVSPRFTSLENHPKLPEAVGKSLTAFLEISILVCGPLTIDFFGNRYFAMTMVYRPSTSLEIVFWMLVFSLLTGFTMVFCEYQGFGFSEGGVW
jgi:hypothetical protein